MEIAVIRNDDAFSLNRFDEEGSDRAGCQRLFQRRQVIEGDLEALGKKGTEAGPEILVAIQRQRPIGQAVEGVTAIDDTRAAGRGTGKFDRRLDGLGPGIGEKHLVQMGHKSNKRSARTPESTDTSIWTRLGSSLSSTVLRASRTVG